jgi:hypothetical protein
MNRITKVIISLGLTLTLFSTSVIGASANTDEEVITETAQTFSVSSDPGGTPGH